MNIIEIITENVEMPNINKRKFQKNFLNNKWIVIDKETDKVVYKGIFENVALVCHNLNKKYYKNLKK